MKIVEPQVELWKQEPTLEGAWHQIAKATRVCYQSKPRKGESDEAFVDRVIFKPARKEDGSIDFDKCHGAMLEHGTIYLTIPDTDENTYAIRYMNNKYSKVMFGDIYDKENTYVTTNMRVILEHKWQDDLKFISAPTYHARRTTFSVITDIGVTRELNRHRVNSIAEQSTRYCTYSADKFGNEITYTTNDFLASCMNDLHFDGFTIDSYFFRELCEDIANNEINHWGSSIYYVFGLLAAEFAYLGLKENKIPNDIARQVLNLNTKSQAVYTAFDDDWKHFIKLRADNVSGKVHPNMKIIADKIKELFNKK
jgi:thymidylate synthase (FAD)